MMSKQNTGMLLLVFCAVEIVKGASYSFYFLPVLAGRVHHEWPYYPAGWLFS